MLTRVSAEDALASATGNAPARFFVRVSQDAQYRVRGVRQKNLAIRLEEAFQPCPDVTDDRYSAQRRFEA